MFLNCIWVVVLVVAKRTIKVAVRVALYEFHPGGILEVDSALVKLFVVQVIC